MTSLRLEIFSPKDRTRLTWLVSAVLLVVMLISAALYYDRVWEIATLDELVLNDFKGIYAASQLIAARQNPYDYSLAREIVTCTNCPYQLPPFLGALLSLLAGFTGQQIQLIWLVVNQIALLITLIFAIRLVIPRPPVWMMLLSAALVFGFYPLYTDLTLGNVSVLLGCLVTLAAWFWQRDQRVLAGFCLGLGMVIKFVPGLLLLYLLWKREFRLAIYSVAFALVLLVLPDILMQTSYLQTYLLGFTQVLDRWAIGSLSHIDNQSLHGVFARFYVLATGTDEIAGFVRLFSVALTGLLAAALIWLSPPARKPTSPYTMLEYTLFLFLFPLGSSNTWSHYYAWVISVAIVMIYLLAENIRQRPGWISSALAFMALAGFIMTSQPYRLPRLLGVDAQVPTLTLGAFGVTLQSVLVYGAVLIMLAGLGLLWRNRQTDVPTA